MYNAKASIHAPCLFISKGKNGKREDSYPGIGCSLDCKSCGWNPEEKKRRLKEGHFEVRSVTHSLHDDTGTTVIETITRDCKKLIFPKREEVQHA